jgi:hypothetical protein
VAIDGRLRRPPLFANALTTLHRLASDHLKSSCASWLWMTATSPGTSAGTPLVLVLRPHQRGDCSFLVPAAYPARPCGCEATLFHARGAAPRSSALAIVRRPLARFALGPPPSTFHNAVAILGTWLDAATNTRAVPEASCLEPEVKEEPWH